MRSNCISLATRLATLVVASLTLVLVFAQVSAADGGAHDYFNALLGRPDHWRSFSLREPRQLDHPRNGGYAHSNTRELVVTYSPETDGDPRRQDAAKVFIPAGQSNLTNQVRLPLGNRSEGFLITWDVWMAKEYRFANGKIGGFKHFQLDSGGEIWTEIRSRFDLAQWRYPESVSMVDIRVYKTAGQVRRSVVDGINYGSDSLGGQVANFNLPTEMWTRYWVWIRPRGDGVWWDLSMWMADEERDPVQLFDRAAVRPNGPDGTDVGWGKFWLEYNTSSGNGDLARGDLVSYVRNVVILKAPETVTELLVRPNAGLPLPPPERPQSPTNLRIISQP